MPRLSGWLGTCLSFAAIVFAATGLHAQSSPPPGGSVSGTVTGGDGSPVKVHLRALQEDPLRNYDGYETVASETGHFSFTNIQSGSYTLQAESATTYSPAQETLLVQPGKLSGNHTVALSPKPVLCGHITYEGQPKQSTLYLYHYDIRTHELQATRGISSETDGAFKIAGVPKGISYLSASGVWFPGTNNFSGATPIDPMNVRTSCDYNIEIAPPSCVSHVVTGKIAQAPQDKGRIYQLIFYQTNGANRFPITSPVTGKGAYRSGESFSARLCPGQYEVALAGTEPTDVPSRPGKRIVFDNQSVTVGEMDIRDVQLTPHPMASISGEVTLEVLEPAQACPVQHEHSVTIVRNEDGEHQTAIIDPKNHFSFMDVLPGTYTLTLGPYLRGAVYIRSFTVDDQAVPGREFTLSTAKTTSLHIQLSANPVEAQGHIAPDMRDQPRWEVDGTYPKASVSGHMAGEASTDTTVVLQAVRFNSSPSNEYRMKPDADGTFQFRAIDPGVYTLRAEGKAIVSTEYGATSIAERGTPLVLNAGARLQGLNLKARKRSVVCGRVVDDSGNPIPNLEIDQERSVRGTVALQRDSSQPAIVRTDTMGRFRYEGLQPGDVYLTASIFAPYLVFFSKSGGLSDAKPLHLAAGEEIGCRNGKRLQLKLPANYKAQYSITGAVKGEIPEEDGIRFWVTLIESGRDDKTGVIAKADVGFDHTFHLKYVPAGKFVLQLFSAPGPPNWTGPYGRAEHLLQSQTINVSSNRNNIFVNPQHLTIVDGTLKFDRPPTPWRNRFDMADERITLRPHGAGNPSFAVTSSKVNWRTQGMDAGDYRLEMDLPAPHYLRSVRLNGQEVGSGFFHIGPEKPMHMSVEIGDGPGQVEATVVDEPDLPKPEPPTEDPCNPGVLQSSSLFLIPESWLAGAHDKAGSARHNLYLEQILRGRSSTGGATFTIRAVPPGQYRAVVVQDTKQFHANIWEEDTPKIQDWWRSMAAASLKVTVAKDQTVKLLVPDRTVLATKLAAKLRLSSNENPLAMLEWR